MPSGRKALPTALKVMRGNPGKRPLNKREPKIKAAIPPCPAHLSDEAQAEWDRMGGELFEMGVLANADRALLAIYAQAWGDLVKAQEMVKAQGYMVISPNGYEIPNPWLPIRNKAVEQIQKIAGEFGMSASARTRIVATKPDAPDDFEERFIGA